MATATSTSAGTALANYSDRLAGLPSDRFIGSILWYAIIGEVERSVGGVRKFVPVRASRTDLEAWFTELGIDTRFLPAEISKINAFRRASTEAIGRQPSYALNDDETATLRVVEVDHNSEKVVRQVQRQVRNRRTEQVYEATVATLRFFRGARSSGRRRHQAEHCKSQVLDVLIEVGLDGKRTGRTFPMTDLDRKYVEAAVADFTEHYDDLAEHYHADALRGVVRAILLGSNAISVKPSGAVYFIHNSRQRTVEQLDALISRIGDGCSFHQLPLLDTIDQREMLTAAWEDEVEDDVRKLLAEIAKVNAEAAEKGTRPSSERYQGIYGRYGDLAERAGEYTRILGLAQERAGSALDLALDALIEMSTAGLSHTSRGGSKKSTK